MKKMNEENKENEENERRKYCDRSHRENIFLLFQLLTRDDIEGTVKK